MPTCGTCDQKLAKSQFERDQLRLGPERRCKACVAATESIFKAALSTRRFDEVSTDAQVERLRSRDANTQMDAANKLWTLTRRGSEVVDRDIAAAGAIRPLADLLRYAGDDRAWTAAMTLQALSCRSDARKAAVANAGAIPLLIALLLGASDDDKEVAAMVLQNLSWSPDATNRAAVVERQRLMVDAGACAPLVALLRAPEDGAREAAAATLASLVSESDEIRDLVVVHTAHADALDRLADMATADAYPEGRHDACRVLKALARRSDDEAAAVADALRVRGFVAGAHAGAGAPEAAAISEALPALLERLALGTERESGEGRDSDEIHSDDGRVSPPSAFAPAALAVAVS